MIEKISGNEECPSIDIFGFSSIELIKLLTLKAKYEHPDRECVLEYIPAFLRQFHEEMANQNFTVNAIFSNIN